MKKVSEILYMKTIYCPKFPYFTKKESKSSNKKNKLFFPKLPIHLIPGSDEQEYNDHLYALSLMGDHTKNSRAARKNALFEWKATKEIKENIEHMKNKQKSSPRAVVSKPIAKTITIAKKGISKEFGKKKIQM
jgi:hypothetical protein